MDDYEKRLMEKLQEKYRKLYGVDFSGSGIFVKKKPLFVKDVSMAVSSHGSPFAQERRLRISGMM